MIRLSRQEDREGLIALWQEAFGDSREAVEFFLDKRFSVQNTLVAEENGKIASMLYLLEGKVKVDKTVLNAYYLYAAATLKDFRGKGIMAQMLEAAKELAQSRGVDLICLKPAVDSLYEFYNKHGYKTVFKMKKAVVSVTPVAEFYENSDYTDMYAAREAVFENADRFIWDKDAINFAVEQHKYYGGNVYCDCNGYCLYSADDGVCGVKESAFTPDKLNQILLKISHIEKINEFKLDLPPDYPIACDDYFVSNNGMALFVSDRSKLFEENNNLYLNLTLD